MVKLTFVSVAGVLLLLTLLLGCGVLGFAVREGLAQEVLVWLPPQGKYQLIVRVGPDALPWDRRANRPTAINVWAHGRGTDWHLFKVIGVPLGQRRE
jgi:hypothetical protein